MVNKANTSQNTSINKSAGAGGGGSISGGGAGGSSAGGGKKRKVKRLSNQNAYYLSAFISNPCEQLFGPSLAYSIDLNTSADQKDKSSLTNNDSNLDDLETSAKSETEIQTATTVPVPPTTTSTEIARQTHVHIDEEHRPVSVVDPPPSNQNKNAEPVVAPAAAAAQQQLHENSFEYIPAPRWNKSQNSILEELFKKSRYPKSAELKQTAQRLHVMDTDVEEWFRKRRGRDRKTRRKNEALKCLIDNYLDK